MKKVLSSLVMAAGVMAAGQSQAALTHCSMDYKVKSVAIFAEFGSGDATVTCQDVVGQSYTQNLDVTMAGLGAKLGVCKAEGNIEAAGVGFSFEEFIKIMGRAEIGLLLGDKFGGTVDVGASINPTLDMQVTVGKTSYSGWCLGLGSIQGLFFKKDGEPVVDDDDDISDDIGCGDPAGPEICDL
ncbi:MAG: hypothetical protein HRU09_05890 [Oligoflexales bacterium]|nr:hypothetical protein [Oligoflexales bacterium]